MVLINDIKYACQACIKGHRSSSCAHTDRPLFEIKKKGRPPTQCSHCRDLRKKKQIHVKCMCEARGPLILDPSQITEGSSSNLVNSTKGKGQGKKKKKDITLSAPALPNGLKDVPALSLVSGLKKEDDDDDGLVIPMSLKKGKAKIETTVKQCLCRVGGECHCFTEKHVPRKDGSSIESIGPTFDSSAGSGSGCCPSVFSPSASHDPNLASTPSSSSSPALSAYSNVPPTPMALPAPFADYFPSPLATHEPIASSTNHMSSSFPSRYTSSGQLANRPLPSHLSRASHYTPYPLPSSHLLNRFQVQNPAEKTTLASKVSSPEEILRRGLKELVGNYIRARMETSTVPLVLGREKGEPSCHKETSGDQSIRSESKMRVTGLPNLSAIYEDAIGDVLMVSACTCGKDCKCPSCKEHGNNPEGVGNGAHVDCPETCSSCFNCSSSVALPANLTTVADLFSASVAMLPASNLSSSQFMPRGAETVSLSDDTQFSKDAFGSDRIPVMECCDGQCQCPPGECTCMKDCCGCCEKCLCERTASDLETSFDLEGNPSSYQATATISPLIEPNRPNSHPSCCSIRTDQTSTMPHPSSIARPSFTSSLVGHPVPMLTEQSSCCSKTQHRSILPDTSSSSQISSKTGGGGGCCSGTNSKTLDANETQHPPLSEDVAHSFGETPSGSTPSSMLPNLPHTPYFPLDQSHGPSIHDPRMFLGMHQSTGSKDVSETDGTLNYMSTTGNEMIEEGGQIRKDQSGLDGIGGFEFNLDLELAIAATLGDTGHGFSLVQPSIQQPNEPTPSMTYASSTGTSRMDPPGYSMDFNAILASIASQPDPTNLGHSTFTPSASSSEQTATTASNKFADFQPSINNYADNRLSPSENHARPVYSLSKDSSIHPSPQSSSSVASSNPSLPIAQPPSDASTTPDTVPSPFDLDRYLHQVLNVTHLDNTFSASNTPSPFLTSPSFTPRHNINQPHYNKLADEKVFHQENNPNTTESPHKQEYSMSSLRPDADYHKRLYSQQPRQSQHPPQQYQQHRQQQPIEGSIRFSDELEYPSTGEGQVDWVALGL